MRGTIDRIAKLLGQKRGISAIEYGLVAALIGAALAVVVPAFQGDLQTFFTAVGTDVTDTINADD